MANWRRQAFICIPGSRESISYSMLLEPKRRTLGACLLPWSRSEFVVDRTHERGAQGMGKAVCRTPIRRVSLQFFHHLPACRNFVRESVPDSEQNHCSNYS